MASDPLILGFDTSAAHCAAALLRGQTLLDASMIEMSRGQAEELMPLLESLLVKHGAAWSDLDAIGVGIGPGNFTGIRISVSAARGLSLGLNIPCVGVSTFEATRLGQDPSVVASVPAPRDQQYVQEPGQAAKLVDSSFNTEAAILTPPVPTKLAENIARCALAKKSNPPQRPAPLYIRAADAAPSRDLPPKIL